MEAAAHEGPGAGPGRRFLEAGDADPRLFYHSTWSKRISL